MIQRSLALILCGFLAAPAPIAAQQPAAQPNRLVAQSPSGLKIVVIQGEGTQNNIRTRSSTQAAVEVRDENDQPVAGAEVVFQLPAAGPGGVFHGWMRTQTVKTNAQGQAGASGFTPNDEEGRFNIKVTATHGEKTASIVISQSNVRSGGAAAGGRGRSGWWIVAGIAGAAIGGGVYAATRNGDTTPGRVTNPVVISAGPITVAGPR